ncbi:MAG TPA: cupin domain-containing protein [Usitatibacteraceae bacterium]|nr:cupin domain-containing protein [Usitatibacteraceae bacterium]
MMKTTLAAATLALVAAVAIAQAPAIKRTILQRGEVAETGREVVLGMAEIAAGGSTGRHTHFGPETGYVLEGSTMLEIDGEAPKLLKAGDSYFIPAGRVHDARAHGGTAKVIATYVVEKGKPLATPAP